MDPFPKAPLAAQWLREKQFRGGLVFMARRLVVLLNSRPTVIKKKKKAARPVTRKSLNQCSS